MSLLRRAAFAAIVSSWFILVGCGNTFRPIATPVPVPAGNPQTADSVAILNVNPLTTSTGPVPPSGSFTLIDVGGDSNLGNFAVGQNSSLTAPVGQITFASTNSLVATADPNSDTVTVTSPLIPTTTTVSLPAGSNPSFVAATATTGLILVAMQPNANSGCTAAQGSIGIIQASTSALTTTVCLPNSTTTIANPSFILVVSADQKALVLDSALSTATILDLPSGNVSTTTPLTVGTNPVGAATIDGHTVYVLNQEASGANSDITVIDAVAEAVISTAPVISGGIGASVIIADHNLSRLYVSNTGSANVAVFAASTALAPPLTTVTVGTAPKGLAVSANGSTLYVANTGSNFASIINASNFNVASIAPVSDPTATVTSTAVSKDGTKAYLSFVTSGDLNNTVVILQAGTNTVLGNSAPPPQDPNCNPGSATFSSCTTPTNPPLQRPLQIVPRI